MTRIGLVGAGFMGSTHAAGWAATDAEIVGVTAAADTPAADLADLHGASVYPDLASMLPDVDVVDICTPTHLHAEMVLEAARTGTHVVCEKPLARTVEQGERMVSACRDAGVHLLVAHVVRFFPEYAAARRAVVDGDVGEPAVLRLSRATFQPRKAADNWFVDQEKSGGLVFDLMIHDIDYARWIAGDVETVLARGLLAARPDAPADHAFAILRHRGGALTHLEASWAHPAPTFRTRGEIAGDAGVVSWDSDRTDPVRSQLRHTADAGDIPLAGSTLAEDPYTTEIRHFLDVLRGDAEPVVTAADGLAALRIAQAVSSAMETGEVVTLTDAEVPA